jgi:hypothetical protein
MEEAMWSNSVKLCGLILVVGLAILSSLAAVQAQADATNTPAEPNIVQLTTADGQTLEAEYWGLSADQTPASGAPAVVVMHAFYANRQAGLPLVEPLMQAGYHVLLVGNYRQEVVGDVQTWLDWLRDQPGVRPDAISTLGSGVGGTTALISCANDEQCVTAISVSGGISGFMLPPSETAQVSALAESALSEGLSDRSALLIASHDDSYTETEAMIPLAEGEIGLRLYAGSDARESLFSGSRHADDVIHLIVSWLDEHTPAAV